MDSIFTLSTYDRNKQDKIRGCNLTITEIDQQNINTKQSKLESIDFSLSQIALFSKYLKKNVHSATSNGYNASMIMNFISTPELYNLVGNGTKADQ